MKNKIIQILEEINGEFLYSLNVGEDFLSMTHNPDSVKESTDKVVYVRMKNCHITNKNTKNKVKEQITNRGEYLQHVSQIMGNIHNI